MKRSQNAKIACYPIFNVSVTIIIMGNKVNATINQTLFMKLWNWIIRNLRISKQISLVSVWQVFAEFQFTRFREILFLQRKTLTAEARPVYFLYFIKVQRVHKYVWPKLLEYFKYFSAVISKKAGVQGTGRPLAQIIFGGTMAYQQF